MSTTAAAPTTTQTGGFAVGDPVTIGTGKTVWTIDSFTDYTNHGGWHAHLEATTGYAKNTVHVDRLRAVA